MDLLAISPPNAFPEEPRWIERLLDAGLARYHLRKPDWPLDRLQAFLDLLPSFLRPRIILHQHYPLVEQMGLGGWHLRDTPQAGTLHQDLRNAGAPSSRLSRSLHSLRDLTQSLDGFAYGFLSPVFPSLSKPNHAPSWSEEDLRHALRVHHAARGSRGAKVHALGGVTPERARPCRDLGFDGLVLHGALWRHPNPLTLFTSLQESLVA